MLLTLTAIASCSIVYARDLGNFMFIMTDNNAYGDLACYGHPTIKTPNIDAGLGIYKETREKNRSKKKRQKKEKYGAKMKQTDHSSELARSELLQGI